MFALWKSRAPEEYWKSNKSYISDSNEGVLSANRTFNSIKNSSNANELPNQNGEVHSPPSNEDKNKLSASSNENKNVQTPKILIDNDHDEVRNLMVHTDNEVMLKRLKGFGQT